MNLGLVARNLGQFILVLSILMGVSSLLSLFWVSQGDADELWAFQALIACSLIGALFSLTTRMLARAIQRC